MDIEVVQEPGTVEGGDILMIGSDFYDGGDKGIYG